MKLAQSPVQPPPVVGLDGEEAPARLLVERGMFWRAATVITVLAAHNFHTLGAPIWRHGQLPTVQHLMQVTPFPASPPHCTTLISQHQLHRTL